MPEKKKAKKARKLTLHDNECSGSSDPTVCVEHTANCNCTDCIPDDTYLELLKEWRRLQLLVDRKNEMLAIQANKLQLYVHLIRLLRKYLNPPTKVNANHDPVSLRKRIQAQLAILDEKMLYPIRNDD